MAIAEMLMSEDDVKAIHIRLDPELLARVDAFAAAHRPKLNRRQAVEMVLAKGLEALEKAEGEKRKG